MFKEARGRTVRLPPGRVIPEPEVPEAEAFQRMEIGWSD